MNFLLDTNVVSEWLKPRPDSNVVSWLEAVDEDRTFLSVMTLGEIRRGIELLSNVRRRDRLTAWLIDELPCRFEGRLIEINRKIANAWGILTVRAMQSGLTVPSTDALFAATAEVYDLTLVTRNARDFAGLGIELLNPWEGWPNLT